MATSPVETVGTSYQLTRRDGLKLSAEREAYCFEATASDPSPTSVDLDQRELCRGNLFCAQYPQISPGGQPAVASFLAALDGGDITHQIALVRIHRQLRMLESGPG